MYTTYLFRFMLITRPVAFKGEGVMKTAACHQPRKMQPSTLTVNVSQPALLNHGGWGEITQG